MRRLIDFLPEKPGRYPLLVLTLVLMVGALWGPVGAQTSKADRVKIVRQVADKWIQRGTEQYRQGSFKAAEQSFLRALDYRDYLTDAERKKLQELLEKTQKALSGTADISEHIQKANELISQGQLVEAKEHLEKIQGDKFLTETARQQLAQRLRKLDVRLKFSQLFYKPLRCEY